MLKDNIRAYWMLLKGIITVTRVMAFEKFTGLFFTFYVLISLSIASVLWLIDWRVSVVIFIFTLAIFTKVFSGVGFLKRALIRKGDKVEYADPSEEGKDLFKKADIVLKMRLEEVKKTRLISDELMQDNKHFYLAREGKDVKVIAYDWIIGLSPEILETDFVHEED